MGSVLKFGKRVPKTKQYPHGWKEIYKYLKGPVAEESLLGHKSVVCFPGDGTIYDEDMNGYCKNVEYMLKNSGILSEDMPDLYSVGFDTDTTTHRQQLLEKAGVARYGLQEKSVKDYWSPFFNTYILPLVQSENGQPLPISETMQNLQNVTFVTHCHGSLFAQQIEQLLYEKVKELYPGKEKEVMGNIRMMHFASRKEVNQHTGVKHFNIVSLADDMYADYGVLAEDHIYKLLQRQNMDERSAIIPVNDDETIMVFKELSTLKTYGVEGRDDHSRIMAIISGRETKSKDDDEFLANENALYFVRLMLRHFVEHPEDTGTIKDIMKDVDNSFLAENLQSGQKVVSGVLDDRRFDKSLLDFLSHYSLRGVEGEAPLYLQKMANGKYFYEQIKEKAQKTGDFISFRSLLKKVRGHLSNDIKIKEINEAVQRKDRSTVEILMVGFPVLAIPKYILKPAKPDDLAFLYPEIRKARLCDVGQREILDDLLKKSEKIKNSSDRVRVQRFLRQEKEKSDANRAPRVVRTVQGRQ